MRLRKITDKITVNVVAGTSSVLFSIDMKQTDTTTLLGFYIRKENNKQPQQAYDVHSIKHFQGASPSPNGLYSTEEQPWQSFLWEDYYVSNDGDYLYFFTPVYGQPGNLTYGEKIEIPVDISKAKDGKHELHFNRGVAGSQAYAREFGNRRPDEMPPAEKEKALTWLSKGLKEAMIAFIGQANGHGKGLRCCFYEFIFPEVLQALKDAHASGADVKIIYDSRHEKTKNDKAIETAGIPREMMIRRTADPAFLQHNKYMVLLEDEQPVAVSTGSTNITEKAIFGHCNTLHIVRDPAIAENYLKHWEGLESDPLNEAARANAIAIKQDPKIVSSGTTTLFSPRPGTKVLKLYSQLIANSQRLVCGMFPFSFNKGIKSAITQDTEHLKYIIIDKKTKNTTLVTNDVDNVIIYGGSYDEPLYGWAQEVDSGELFYSGVNFIHNKVILIDPLSDDPIVITGSANFSDNSILRNDENTMVIRGDRDVADSYFTEFARIFNHYASRQDTIKLKPHNTATNYNPSILETNPANWTASFYKSTALKFKRRDMFSAMNATVIP
ncbi:Phosphatidylserine/phosphatidylglycerophosphate/cardiolipin synthase [Mucilaginibacter sp. OK268]|uniref:phospholipase D-like domain-containing protein n=1 Tax=Mucilaginibacter sp. OK268 TaxID=1881048 RepID=UPI000881C97A|nr:phospholipase D-like domain-containing protein [Mucilaginibacter sp. OK268]SDP47381.1 Phosphatidylserine/phosphatidylglycerophosphate/cardiolipin synthase [Mucilaginibacter sp. OK268]